MVEEAQGQVGPETYQVGGELDRQVETAQAGTESRSGSGGAKSRWVGRPVQPNRQPSEW